VGGGGWTAWEACRGPLGGAGEKPACGGLADARGGQPPAGALPHLGALEDQVLAHLSPAQREEVRELVLVWLAVDRAVDDDVRCQTLVPRRAADEQALDLESWVWQQAPEALEPAADVARLLACTPSGVSPTNVSVQLLSNCARTSSRSPRSTAVRPLRYVWPVIRVIIVRPPAVTRGGRSLDSSSSGRPGGGAGAWCLPSS
jgi:hypothetical protein